MSRPVDLLAPLDIGALAQSGGRPAFAAWSAAAGWVRPCVKVVLVVHLMAVVAGAWKAENLGNDTRALLFGIVETAVVLGYQVFQGVMVVDDLMMGRRAPASHDQVYWPLAKGPLQAEAAGASAREGTVSRDGKGEEPGAEVPDRLAGS
ncbi:unnamed protein product [Prorocentrum cordatum]|uniref:Uncharacterized protein n=1 Tax=Prorocentrum cordatum TaxID=2364126 RepID=A0ABN9WAD8_9DINO|nr:unnamed protein product [Polarella glacialis]